MKLWKTRNKIFVVTTKLSRKQTKKQKKIGSQKMYLFHTSRFSHIRKKKVKKLRWKKIMDDVNGGRVYESMVYRA